MKPKPKVKLLKGIWIIQCDVTDEVRALLEEKERQGALVTYTWELWSWVNTLEGAMCEASQLYGKGFRSNGREY